MPSSGPKLKNRTRKKKAKVSSPSVHRKGQYKKPSTGKPLRPSFQQNCLSCFNFYNCRDPDKSNAYLCDKFSDIEDSYSQMVKVEELSLIHI